MKLTIGATAEVVITMRLRRMFRARYRATLCVSAAFAITRCPSVRHVDGLYPIQAAEDIVELRSRPGSPITVVFWLYAPVPNCKGNPLSGGAKYMAGGGNLRFSTEIAIYLGKERYEVGPVARGCYGTLIGNHRWRISPCLFRWPWVTRNPGFTVLVTSRMS